jgi:hypothetical protein
MHLLVDSTGLKLIMLGAAASRPRMTKELSAFVHRTRLPFFNTQMGKGTVAGGSNLYMGTAALSRFQTSLSWPVAVSARGPAMLNGLPFQQHLVRGRPQLFQRGRTPDQWRGEWVTFPKQSCRPLRLLS